eukprot:2910023-Rhodomonas_salina.3
MQIAMKAATCAAMGLARSILSVVREDHTPLPSAGFSYPSTVPGYLQPQYRGTMRDIVLQSSYTEVPPLTAPTPVLLPGY